jgi:Mor family transcriptional regulator
MEKIRHELLSDVADHSKRVLEDHGIDENVAEQAGLAIANFLAEHWGGQLVNIPKDHVFKLAQRDIEIYDAFTGHNHSELARKFKMTTRGIYKVIARAQKRDMDFRQPRLF